MGDANDVNWDEDEPVEVPLDPAITSNLYRKWRAPRFGQANPERMNNPVWEWLVRSRATAYTLTQRMGAPSALDAGAGWCFQRFGQTRTTLPDGRRVYIAGEHEDYYDPDFCIYNDVVVLHRDGHVDIFGYPGEVFPPTDSHSATLFTDKIFIIGGLGYPEQRNAQITPVFCLDTNDYTISKFPSSGDCPGLLYKHTAELSEDGSALVVRGGKLEKVRNINEWRLQLHDGVWQQMTDLPWQIWHVRRKHKEMLHLWQVRSQLTLESMGQQEAFQEQMREHYGDFVIPTLEQELGGKIDAEAFSQLFHPPMEHETIPGGEDPNLHHLRINGVSVWYEEDLSGIEITFESGLAQDVMSALVKDVTDKLARVEKSPCVAKKTCG